MGTTIYLTSLALSAVTPLSMALSIVLTAGICTLYTSMVSLLNDATFLKFQQKQLDKAC